MKKRQLPLQLPLRERYSVMMPHLHLILAIQIEFVVFEGYLVGYL